jgi:hypothetical protein
MEIMKIKYAIYLVLIVFVSSCTDNFEDFNTDKKNPATVPGEALFTNALRDLSVQMNTPDVNSNLWELWSQYWNETTYVNETNYDIGDRDQPEFAFRWAYRRVLKDLQEATRIIGEGAVANAEEEVAKANKLHIIEIMNVFVYQRLVDIFGAVPYSEALDIGNVYPSYDMGVDIYDDILVSLDAAISELDESAGSFGSEDLIYHGDVQAWKIFANSLKLKIGINLSDVNSAKAQSTIEAAVAAGVFTSTSDEALFPFQTSAPHFNPIYGNLVASGRNDYVAANTMIDIMVNVNDPRLDDYFDISTIRPLQFPRDPATGSQTDANFPDGVNKILFYPLPEGGYDPIFREGPFTVPAADTSAGIRVWLGGTYGDGTPWSSYTQVALPLQEPTFPGLILTYSQVLFYLAEAAERGYDVGGTPEEFYNAGVTESILWWGGTQNEVEAYLDITDVAYPTADGSWRKKIAYQSWISSYINGFLGYTTWRRLDYPVLNITPNNDAIVDQTDIPVRFPFPVNEQTLNDVNYDNAANAIGGDNMNTKIFWDIYDAQIN